MSDQRFAELRRDARLCEAAEHAACALLATRRPGERLTFLRDVFDELTDEALQHRLGAAA